MGDVILLDCTLRDGGFAIEDAKKNFIPHKEFDKGAIKGLSACIVASGAEAIEIGAVEETVTDNRGFAVYPTLEEISGTVEVGKNQIKAAFFRGPDISLDKVPDYREGLCELVRVALRYSELDKSLDYAKQLVKKGYKVSLQPVVTMRYTERELHKVIFAAGDMGAYAVYCVDSYGCMGYGDIDRLFKFYDKNLSSDIRIGFHAHNNMNQAYANVQHFLEIAGARDVVVDACCMGMGQGAGNAQSEVLIPYLNEKYHKSYDFGDILEGCDIVEGYWGDILWGYTPTTLIPAIYKIAYKYAIVLKHTYHYLYREINEMMKLLPEERKHRYTPDNVKWLIDTYNRGRK